MGYLSCNAEAAIATCDPYNWDRKKKQKNRNRAADKPFEIREFSTAELESASNGFSAESFLGKGSHGRVYRAVLDGGRLVAAVKRTTRSKPHKSNQNIHNPAENEIEILSRVRNPRLVNLLGFGVDSEEKLIVVEFMPNGSLYDQVHRASRPPGWTRRVRFALQIAKAVESLHSANPPVIHRDIKSSNILLDEHWNAKLGDFGLALRGHVEDVRVRCTPPAGTLGYLDPSYLAPGDLSTKSDVFSFGILLLEVVSGRNAIDLNYSPPSLVDWAAPLIKRGEFAAICDPHVGPPADPGVIQQLALLASRCVRSTADKRPSMAEVAECLRIIDKRVRAPVWNSVRRRVERVRNASPVITREVLDGSEVVVKASKIGGRRSRKVSSVPILEYGKGERVCLGGDRVGRSRSIGYAGETKVGSGINLNECGNGGPSSGVTVKLPVVRLRKSRSMGALERPRMVTCNNDKVVIRVVKGPRLEELDGRKLLASVKRAPKKEAHEGEGEGEGDLMGIEWRR